MKCIRAALIAFVAVGLVGSPAFAIPALQLYIDGATYDSSTDTWVITASTFDLWVIGNVGGLGESILDVKLAAAVATAEAGSISLMPTTTSHSGLPGSNPDPSTPDMPGAPTVSADGAIPQLVGGGSLPSHGVYGSGVSFWEWSLGNLTMTDSPVGDFIDTFPTSFPQMGQINVYTVTVAGFASGVHFDLYNHVEAANHSLKAPFSHDAESQIPEPATLLLLGLGLAGGGFASHRRRRR